MDISAPADGLLDDRWRLGSVIGRGAAADVHAATDTWTGDDVAVKIIRSPDGDAARRFEREVAALEGVEHPGIVGVLGHGACPDGRPFVVLEKAGGGTLHDVLASGPLGPAEAAAMGAVVAEALAHAHDRGVVHRDVKPANILLDDDRQPKLGDFGIARLLGAGTITATGLAMGTPAYLAPEQVRGERVGPPADVYALGLVVLEAATGQRAFPGDGLAAALARLRDPVAIPGGLPPAMASTIAAMTAADPLDRPTAADAAARLAAVGDAGATAALPVAAVMTSAMPAAGALAGGSPADGGPWAPPRRPSAHSVPRAGGPRAVAGRRVLVATACFLAGFVGVALLRAALSDGEGGEPPPAVTVDSKTTGEPTTTLATTTTVVPEDEDGEDDDRRDDDRRDDDRRDDEDRGGGGGEGRGEGGNGRGNDDD